MSAIEDLLATHLQLLGLNSFVREHRFHPTRKWRLDFAFPAQRLAVEVEGFGAGGTAGRHQRAAGFTADCEKYAELAIAGWRLMRVTGKQIRSGEAVNWIEQALKR